MEKESATPRLRKSQILDIFLSSAEATNISLGSAYFSNKMLNRVPNMIKFFP